jgi:hypothetical protein
LNKVYLVAIVRKTCIRSLEIGSLKRGGAVCCKGEV